MPHGERRVTCGSAKKTRCGSSVCNAVSSCQRKSAKSRWDAHTVLQTSQLSGTVQHAATQDAMRTWLQPMAEAIGCCVYLESRAPSKKKVNSALYRESSARIDYMCVAPARKGFQFCHGSCGSTSSPLWVRSDRLTKRACNGRSMPARPIVDDASPRSNELAHYSLGQPPRQRVAGLG